MLEIPTDQLVQGRQFWRRTSNFFVIFLQFYVYDMRFKAFQLTHNGPADNKLESWGGLALLKRWQTWTYDDPA